MKYTFKLVKKAKGSGGDKYSCNEWTVYFPQEISRPEHKEPKSEIEIDVAHIV